jgi:aryl sulfotransferase
MRILLSNLVRSGSEPERINALGLWHRGAASRAFFEWETLVDSHLLQPEEIARLFPAACDSWMRSTVHCGFMKTHGAWEDRATPYGQSVRRVVYLVRDPRDIAVSLAAYRKCSLTDSVEFMSDPGASFKANHQQFVQRLGNWSAHACGWLSQTSIPLTVVRYEDLLASAAATLHATLRFLGASFSGEGTDQAIARAVRHSSFEELQRQEAAEGFGERPGGQDGDSVEPFFRKGTAGAWRGVLTEGQVARIEAVHGCAMRRLGYELVSERSLLVSEVKQ